MGAVLCILRYLAASMDSYLLDTGSSSSDVIIKNVSRHFTKCPLGVGGANNLPWLSLNLVENKQKQPNNWIRKKIQILPDYYDFPLIL